MSDRLFDLFIIGGGINGCGIAADASGRGLKVVLCEQADLGGATSSASTKLIHGGLRYLEHYEFLLVRKALAEREVLLRNAPHIIRPIRLLLPYHKELRPFWLIRLGLFLYDNLGGRKLLPSTNVVNLIVGEYANILKNTYRKAFEFSDCVVDDSRLVVLNAMAAKATGAEIYTRNKVICATRLSDCWRIEVQNTLTGKKKSIRAKLLINATGPWVADILQTVIEKPVNVLNQSSSLYSASVRLVKGSHITVPKIYSHEKAYFFQSKDGRVVFTIPYHDDFTLIGTTDVDYSGDPSDVKISDDEVKYLCDVVGEYFDIVLGRDDVVWSYSGVRPLYDDGTEDAKAATRDYLLELDAGLHGQSAPLLNIFGGKITTYRVLAEEVLKKIKIYFPAIKGGWTSSHVLPGGNVSLDGVAEVEEVKAAYPFISKAHVKRLVHSYGSCVWDMLLHVKSLADLGRHFGADLYEVEILYLHKMEWAVTAEDVLWRRTKLGLRFNAEMTLNLESWMKTMFL